MSPPKCPIDCIYVAASARDSRFTRICVASIRYFYPDVCIKLLAGGRLESSLIEEMRKYWNVGIADFPGGDYGWGFVKLEPLFGSSGERFLVLDSDTAFVGPVLDKWQSSKALFLVDEEVQSEVDTKRLYYDWQNVQEVDSDAQPPRFVFNSGQWFGTAGVLTRDDFSPWLQWTMPRRLRHPQLFMPGDQGILNYVFNQKAALDGIPVETKKIMHWPGHGMIGFSAKDVASGTAAPVVVHWAGVKSARQRDTTGADLLGFFEEFYYQHLPGRGVRMRLAACRHVLSQRLHETQAKIRFGVKAVKQRIKG